MGLFTWAFDKIPFAKIKRRGAAALVRPAMGEHFTFLLADLAGDDADRSHTRHILNALDGQPGIKVQ